jgi:ATP synthase protein I
MADFRMAARGGGSGSEGASDAELARRLDRLSRDLDEEKRERAAEERPQRSDSTGYGLAMRLASEFVAGVLVGAALGWGLDRVAGTSPWGLIGLLMLGFCAGVLNVVRASSRISAQAGGGRDGDLN